MTIELFPCGGSKNNKWLRSCNFVFNHLEKKFGSPMVKKNIVSFLPHVCKYGGLSTRHIHEAFVHGKPEGNKKLWHINGALHFSQNYYDGQLHGDNSIWYDNGKLWLQQFFVNGKINGFSTVWFSNGNIQTRMFYSHNAANGEFIERAQDGTLINRIFYIDDVPYFITLKTKMSILAFKEICRRKIRSKHAKELEHIFIPDLAHMITGYVI